MAETIPISSNPIATPLLAWFYANRRSLPFREDPTPYHIWLSEIMLQQTRVSAALPYYHRFIETLPSIPALAACGEEKLHKLWEGLGYYSRVRNMQKAAKIVVEEYGGELPADYEALLSLPGIGSYTAGAIASIAFKLPYVAVDGNVLRVFSRLLNDDSDITLPATKATLTKAVQTAQPADAPGDFNEAVMELGALVCTPGTPGCPSCPLNGCCAAFLAGSAAQLPKKAPKKPKETLQYTLLLVQDDAGNTLLCQRPARGLLAGLWQPVLLAGRLSAGEADATIQEMLPMAERNKALPIATHVFTHKVWQMEGWLYRVAGQPEAPPPYVWASPAEAASQYTIPSAFRAYLPFITAP